MDRLALRVLPDRQDHRDSKEQTGRQALRVLPDLRVLQGLLDLKE